MKTQATSQHTNTVQRVNWIDHMNNSRVGRYMDDIEKTFIAQHLPPAPLMVADVGGGTGRWSGWLRQNGHAQVLFELSLTNLRDLKQRNPHIKSAQSNAEAMPSPAQRFDAALMIQVFDLVSDHHALVSELHRILKPNGLLFITWTNKHSLKGLLYSTYATLKGTNRAERHQIYSTPHTDYLNLMQDAGFSVVAGQGYSWNLLPRSHNTPLVSLFAAMERGLGLNRWIAASPNVILVMRKKT